MSIQVVNPLEKFYQYEQEKANKTFLRQAYNGQWHSTTWKKAGEEIRKMAAALKALNLPPQSKIALVSKNCANWILADLAIMMAGHVSVPLYFTLNSETLNYVLEHSEAKVLFVGKMDGWDKLRDYVPQDVTCISFPLWTEPGYVTWDEFTKDIEPLKENIIPKGSDLITIIYTSGTTGLPKGVLHNFHAFGYAATWAMSEMKDLIGEERFFSYLPLSHIAERMLVEMGGIYTGASISFAESLDTFAQNLKDTKPTVFLAVPRIWTKFQQGILSKMPQNKLNILLKIPFLNTLIKNKIKAGLGLDEAKYLLTGAAPLPLATMQWFEELGFIICEAYAMTENCAYSHLTRKENRKPGSVGTSMPNSICRISEEGEIQVKNECTMIGYYKEDSKTEEAITKDGYLCTGDQGEIDSKGFLKITGRIKDIFKTDKGKYVAPAPIELSLSKNLHIEQACLVGSNLPQTMALVVLSLDSKKEDKADIEKSLEDTMKEINPALEKHERMKKIVIMSEEWTVENNLLTPTMKVKRNVLEKKYESNYENWYNSKENIIWL
ncbi:MAG: AMP-binding protein [Bacteroidetes bacterium]|jgi:long-chain acyl-CoA synthetase|nr:AMP-binding protein [Bacteroidota bacterium]MBP7255444.1 AMP-binding protein [Chitinophagales bacterium]MBK7504668.1 AMP-binding protein [Bacteroidota bacterium]MBK8673823.1 AMP-binding protein [Bacteroidota bacterium]MBK9633726.1 AMP-binding protein [Bacteroidota bacterium]